MKMRPEHYKYMLDAMRAYQPNIKSHRAFILDEGRSKDVEKRLRWDIMYFARLSEWTCANLYDYLNDDHIDTALRAIMKELEQ